jgi:hypothetical protein
MYATLVSKTKNISITKIAKSLNINLKIENLKEFNIKNTDLHKNIKRCPHEILAIIRTDKLIGRATRLQISIKTKTGAKMIGEPAGVKCDVKNNELKLKPKIKKRKSDCKSAHKYNSYTPKR